MNSFYQYFDNFLLKLSKENLVSRIIFSLFCLLPVGLILGTLISESIIILLSILFLFKFKREIIMDETKSLMMSLVFIWIYLIFNLIFSYNLNNSFFRNIFFFKYILFVLGTIKYFTSRKSLIKYIFSFWISVFLIFCSDIYYQFIFKENIFGYVTKIPEHRASGLMFGELKAGSLLFGLSLVPTIYFFKNISYGKKYLILLILIYFVLAIYVTGERSSFLKTLTLILPILFFINKKNLLQIISVLLILLAIVTTIFFNKDTFRSKYYEQILLPIKNYNYNIIKFIDSTIYGRHKIDALNLFNESKFFGVGNKNFRIICNKDKYDFLSSDEFKDSLCTTHPHQFYYELLSEHGLAGITVFILMFLLFFKKFISYLILTKDYLVLSNLIVISSFFYPLLPSGSFFTSFNATIFWINISLIYCFIYFNKKNT